MVLHADTLFMHDSNAGMYVAIVYAAILHPTFHPKRWQRETFDLSTIASYDICLQISTEQREHVDLTCDMAPSCP